MINIKIVIFITLILICIIILLYYTNIFGLKNNYPFVSVWTPKKLETIKNLLNDVETCFKELNIKYFPVYGTLLGLIRHEGLIPWDDDVDICVNNIDYNTILEKKDFFNKKGIEVYVMKGVLLNQPDFIKIFYKNSKKIKDREWSWPFIDIFKFSIKGNKIYIESNTKPYNYIFNYDDIYPFKTNKFENIVMNIPSNVDILLNKFYGNDWQEICYSSSYNHENEIAYNTQYKAKCNEIKEDIDENIFENVFIINLERKKERFEKSIERLKKIGIHPKRFNAIDATSEYIIKYYNEINSKKRTIQEFACYLSHKYLWEYIYSLNIPYAIIFEDDIIFDNDLTKEKILEIINKSKGFNILFLGHCYSNLLPFNDSIIKVGTALCTNAYVITREAIEKLLNLSDNFQVPIDFITKQFCDNNLCYLSYTPHNNKKYEFGQGIIKQDYNFNSDIIKKNF